MAVAFFFVPPDPPDPGLPDPGARQRLTLSRPSRVWHNGTILGFDKWEGDYRRTLEGLVASHDWEWMDRRRAVYRNAVALAPIAFVAPPASVSVSAPVPIEFEPPLGPDERVRMVVADPSWDFLPVAEAWDAGATSMEPGGLWDLVLEDRVGWTVDLVLIRTASRAIGDATSVGGSLEARSRSVPVRVAVEP